MGETERSGFRSTVVVGGDVNKILGMFRWVDSTKS